MAQQGLLPVARRGGGDNRKDGIAPGILQSVDLLGGGVVPVAGRDELPLDAEMTAACAGSFSTKKPILYFYPARSTTV